MEDYRYLVEGHLHEGLVEGPPVMPGDLEVALELLLLGGDDRLGEVGLLDRDDLVSVTLDDTRSVLVAAVLEDRQDDDGDEDLKEGDDQEVDVEDDEDVVPNLGDDDGELFLAGAVGQQQVQGSRRRLSRQGHRDHDRFDSPVDGDPVAGEEEEGDDRLLRRATLQILLLQPNVLAISRIHRSSSLHYLVLLHLILRLLDHITMVIMITLYRIQDLVGILGMPGFLSSLTRLRIVSMLDLRRLLDPVQKPPLLLEHLGDVHIRVVQQLKDGPHVHILLAGAFELDQLVEEEAIGPQLVPQLAVQQLDLGLQVPGIESVK